ncbi:amidohydrolase [Sphingomonas ginkgonis]|uniref:Amidohydrolase n=1 Tax=Sphingomonas ginkgonis TaxID=2315330 RepID=A0A429VCW9_9SPHN|nr:amidohydrolase [Sphingomonas ginkgonis]RST31773.1 amidohydrolase [Sphingomonas ginkgonis]
MTKALLLLASALILPKAASADTLVTHANGLQVGADERLQRFTAMLVGTDGKVKALYRDGQPTPRAEQLVDAGGMTLLPGLIDAHGHIMELGLAALQLDLTGTRSLAEFQRRLKDYAAAHPGERWIIGRGWNQELWADKRFPTVADLDAVVPDRPVVLGRVDGHALVANGAAMRAAGVTSATTAPSGGRIENGLFVDNAKPLIESHVPAPTPIQRDAALAKAQEILLGYGVTASGDMGTEFADWQAMQRAGTAGRLNVRIMSYGLGLENATCISPRGPSPWLFGDRLRMEGVKFYDDGALGSRGAWLKAPYHDMPNTRGLPFHSDAEYRMLVAGAKARGYQIATHAIGDAANAQVINTYVAAGSAQGNRRWRIEHAQIVDPADLPKIGANRIIASMQPTHETSDRLMAEARLGTKRLKGAYAWASMLRTGARLAFGSDYPVESPNPFPGIAAGVSRQGMDGQPPGGWRPEEKLSLAQTLAAFTRGGAWAGFAEQRFGALEPGMWADFILVDRDPTKVDAQELARTQVRETFVAGRKVWSSESAPAR